MMTNKLYYIFYALSVLLLTGCSVTSDLETERKFVGTWESIDKESYYEDGENEVNSYTFRYTYYPDNTFTGEISIDVVEPERDHFGTVKFTGKWKASKEELYEEIDLDFYTFIPNEVLEPETVREYRDIFKEMLEEEKKSTGKILNITKTSFTLYYEDDNEKSRFNRVGEIPEMDIAEENVYEERRIENKQVSSNRLPSWLSEEVLEAFGENGQLSMKSFEYLKDEVLSNSDADLFETNKYEGYFDEYPITLEMKVNEDASVSGRYAYNSILNKYGDRRKSWFPFRGVILFDNRNTPYLLLETRHPDDDRVFEYALLNMGPYDRWSGSLFNAIYLKDAPVREIHDLNFRLK